MSREMTGTDAYRLAKLVLLGIIAVKLCTGCASLDDWHSTKRYHVEAFDIVCTDTDTINKMYQLYPNTPASRIGGFCDMTARVLYVPWSMSKDDHGRLKPLFELLGHEVWHLPELGGRWHK
jgi:hypothetical protein